MYAKVLTLLSILAITQIHGSTTETPTTTLNADTTTGNVDTTTGNADTTTANAGSTTAGGSNASTTVAPALPFIYKDGPVGEYTTSILVSFNVDSATSTLSFNVTLNVPGFNISTDSFNCSSVPYVLSADNSRVIVTDSTNACLNSLVSSIESTTGNSAGDGTSLIRLGFTASSNSLILNIAGVTVHMFSPNATTTLTAPNGLYVSEVSSTFIFDPTADLVTMAVTANVPNLPKGPVAVNCTNVPYYPSSDFERIFVTVTNDSCVNKLTNGLFYSPGDNLRIRFNFDTNVLSLDGFFDGIDMAGPPLDTTTPVPTNPAGVAVSPTGAYVSSQSWEVAVDIKFDPTNSLMDFDIRIGYRGYNQESWNCSGVSYNMNGNQVLPSFSNNSCFFAMMEYYQSFKEDGSDVLTLLYSTSNDQVTLGGKLISPSVLLSKQSNSSTTVAPVVFADATTEGSTTSFSSTISGALWTASIMCLVLVLMF
jgi:hypothetical protein